MTDQQHFIAPSPELQEEWRPVPGYAGLYSVSSLGDVRSEDRIVAHGTGQRLVKGRILVQNRTTNGYLAIRLCRNGCFCPVRVHQLVAQAFIGPPPPDSMVDHIDRNRRNNKANNLRWVTKCQNMRNTPSRGSSGFKFAYPTDSGRYAARYKPGLSKRMISCGIHSTPYEAHIAAVAHRLEHQWNP